MATAAVELRVEPHVCREPRYFCCRIGCSGAASVQDGVFYYCSGHALEKLRNTAEFDRWMHPGDNVVRL